LKAPRDVVIRVRASLRLDCLLRGSDEFVVWAALEELTSARVKGENFGDVNRHCGVREGGYSWWL
jgi:hypothetical protein